MNAPMLLMYRFSAKKAAKLRMICMKLGIRARAVAKWEYLAPIGSFTGECSAFESFYDKEDLGGEMMVMAHFPDSLLDRFLQAFRQAGLPPVACKAILTDTNKAWNSLELWVELSAEHKAMQANTTAHPEP